MRNDRYLLLQLQRHTLRAAPSTAGTITMNKLIPEHPEILHRYTQAQCPAPIIRRPPNLRVITVVFLDTRLAFASPPTGRIEVLVKLSQRLLDLTCGACLYVLDNNTHAHNVLSDSAPSVRCNEYP